MSSNDHDIHVLNGLIGMLQTSEHLYLRTVLHRQRSSGGAPPVEGLKDQAARNAVAFEALGEAVRALGGSPPSSPGVTGEVQALLGGFGAHPQDAAAEADLIERVEASHLKAFGEALRDERISGPVRDAILRTFDTVKEGHDLALQTQLRLSGEA